MTCNSYSLLFSTDPSQRQNVNYSVDDATTPAFPHQMVWYIHCLWGYSSNITSILNRNINATCKVLVPCFMSWNKKKIPEIFHMHKNWFTFLLVSISPLPRSSIHLTVVANKSWLISIIITQVQLVLRTIEGHSKMCSFVMKQCHRCREL